TRFRLDGLPGLQVEGSGGVPTIIVLLCLRVAFAFCCQRVNQNRAVLTLLSFTQGGNQGTRVVTVHVAYIFETKLIDERAWKNRRSNSVFHRLRRMMKPPTNRRYRE